MNERGEVERVLEEVEAILDYESTENRLIDFEIPFDNAIGLAIILDTPRIVKDMHPDKPEMPYSKQPKPMPEEEGLLWALADKFPQLESSMAALEDLSRDSVSAKMKEPWPLQINERERNALGYTIRNTAYEYTNSSSDILIQFSHARIADFLILDKEFVIAGGNEDIALTADLRNIISKKQINDS
ncbi:MAG TPA: hypothetical protein VG965_03830 [Patescibacteria group bacterium]|nr:hypothetical protein [Patescibacteria group bacterium]